MIEYVVDKENKVVIAYLRDTACEVPEFICRNIFDMDKKMNCDLRSSVLFKTYKYLLPMYFSGIAKCESGDDFDVEVGKEIAKKKVLLKYYSSKFKRIKKFKDSFEKYSNEINSKLESSLEKIVKRENELSGVEYPEPELPDNKESEEDNKSSDEREADVVDSKKESKVKSFLNKFFNIKG